MFTGIIEDLGRVASLQKQSGLYVISIKSKIFPGEKIGDSISVNGVCLTIAGLEEETAFFEVMSETIGRTAVTALRKQDSVNLERSLKIGGRVGGHFVTGHIDCLGKIIRKETGRGNYCIRIKVPQGHIKFAVQKGSIALDGVSLTVGDLDRGTITVFLIPHTYKHTTLGFKKIDDDLNVDFDMLGKYALNRVHDSSEPAPSKITETFLKSKGFC